ncbi:GNAT family N-acetyltransferase, partial [Streptomyces achromogenes]|uniref:GNAT family N-acetyltransferase n=1 Tax=Streptomyces achromogenes TaxID=67255 RepID=UPI0033DC325A
LLAWRGHRVHRLQTAQQSAPSDLPVGIHIPARNPSGPCVGFIGVVPEQRGHGYAYDLLADCTHFLAGQGARFIGAATDQGNLPMAAHFTKAGYPVVWERVNYWATPGAR